jgi:hypothetical protein
VSILDVEFFEEPTHPSNPDWVNKEIERERDIRQQRRQACLVALPAMDRLAEVLKDRSGQPYKLRSLLYSLWNGKPASLVEIVNFDWEIRQDLLLVLAAFGYEDHKVMFFYDALRMAIERAGQWKWFLEERKNIELLRQYVESARREEEER